MERDRRFLGRLVEVKRDSDTKVLFFDCDETLWSSGGDYASSVDSGFSRIGQESVVRIKDGKLFTLKSGVLSAFKFLSANQDKFAIGIISDNQPAQVVEMLKLFGLWDSIDPAAVNVKLWTGHCPKEVMVGEVMAKEKFSSVIPGNIYLVDDRDYSEQMQKLGANFIQVGPDSDLLSIVQAI